MPQIIKQPSLISALYGFMTELLIFKSNRLFYAFLFTLPTFIVIFVGISCFLLFILSCDLPIKLVNWINKSLDKLVNLFHKKWLITASLWVFAIAFLISYTNYRLPVYWAGTAQLFQAKLLAMGKLSQPINFSREFFEFPLLRFDTNIYAAIPPGGSFLLAIGQKLGIPWLINPLLGALALFVIYLFTKRIYTTGTAVLSIFLIMLSCSYLSLSAGYTNILAFILFLALGLFFYDHSLMDKEIFYPVLCGLCFGLAVMMRPAAALVMLLPFLVYFIYLSIYSAPSTKGGEWDKRKPYIIKFLALLAGAFIPLSILAIYNHSLFNNIWGALAGNNVTSYGIKSIFYLAYNISILNERIWSGIIPVFLFIMLFFILNEKPDKWDGLLWSSFTCLLIFNPFIHKMKYGFANPLMAGLPFLVLLTARAMTSLPDMFSRLGFSSDRIKALLALGVVVSSCFLLTYKIPGLVLSVDNQRNKLLDLTREEKINNAVIFVNDKIFKEVFAYNKPDLTNDIVFARHLKKYNYKLMQEFPGRAYYFYNQTEYKLIKLTAPAG